MKEIVFKVASRGEGKTKWLLDVANELSTNSCKQYIFTDSDESYRRFCEKYFNKFNKICPVERLTDQEVTSSDYILIDNLFDIPLTTMFIKDLQNSCAQMFVTIEGNCSVDSRC